MGEGVKPLVDHADADDVLNCEYVKHSIEEHVVRQVIETMARTEQDSAQGGWPGQAEGF